MNRRQFTLTQCYEFTLTSVGPEVALLIILFIWERIREGIISFLSVIRNDRITFEDLCIYKIFRILNK